jgi:tripeptide aminopeptidase
VTSTVDGKRLATDGERVWLGEIFSQLCAIPSPTGSERACAQRIAQALRALDLEVFEDAAGTVVGCDSGNLRCLIPGASPQCMLLCAHMDTVPVSGPIEPSLRDGHWVNANGGILGADNKAAVAVMLALARRLALAAHPPAAGLELVFTIAEETGLHGAAALEAERLHGRLGFVFDHASPIGEVVIASPSYDRIDAEIRGRAAHAGLHPELGRSAILAAARAITAMPQGRVDEHTTANVGTICGGSATNVVAERCRIQAEVRGLDEQRLSEVVTETIDCLQDAADRSECDLDVEVTRIFSAYRVTSSSPALVLAEAALRACGHRPRRIASAGGSDANVLRARGIDVVNLANGTERAHEPHERVSAAALEGMLDVAIALHGIFCERSAADQGSAGSQRPRKRVLGAERAD